MIHLPESKHESISFGGSLLGPKRRDDVKGPKHRTSVKGEHFYEALDYKVPTHIKIDTYFSTIPVSKWHRLNDHMNSKLRASPLSTAPDLYRSFHRSLVERNEDGGYPKYIVDYAKKLKTAVKSKKDFFIELAEKIIDRIDRRELMKENKVDIYHASKSKALDDITNAITRKRKRRNENYATSAREPSSDFAISSFGLVNQTWDHVVPKMEIKENFLKDWINEEHTFSEDFRQFQKSIIEKLKHFM
ncbi:21882_t:CDS:2 [Gigaspora rosea]|nr:21882_t:CDS:2 [Gigaspora rosea]